MLSAMYAARNIMGENNDVWDVNVERSYHEEFEVKPKKRKTLKEHLRRGSYSNGRVESEAKALGDR